jgi:hypothetical protein
MSSKEAEKWYEEQFDIGNFEDRDQAIEAFDAGFESGRSSCAEEIRSLKATIEVLSDNEIVKKIADSLEDVKAGRMVSLEEVMGRDEKER